MLDDRAKLLLKALVERYIADGQPVGSRTLAKAAGLELSPATIRNVMSDLEELGLIASPHTSAGRIPTARGYRLFVDTMLTVRREGFSAVGDMGTHGIEAGQPQRVISNAAQMLSSLSHFVGVVMAPRRASVFRHIEFLSLSERRVLVILVSPDGDVQNRIIHTQVNFSQTQLQEAANFLNAHYSGLTMEEVRARLKVEVDALRGEIASLMQAAVNIGEDATGEQDEVVVSGERNLLSVSEFSSDMGNLRRMFDLDADPQAIAAALGHDDRLRPLLEAGLCATVNSDDPAYFGGYINTNFTETFAATGLTAAHAYQLARNSFEASFVSDADRAAMFDALDRSVGQAALA